MKPGSPYRLRLYRGLARVLEPVVEKRARNADLPRAGEQEIPPPGEKPRVWFHAASVGELESLSTVIEAWSIGGGEAVLTIFSKSATKAARRLAESVQSRGGSLILLGYAPWEGAWAETIRRVSPRVFVTAKYEAWPDLWTSLSQEGVPLLILGAKLRKSLLAVRSACAVLGLSAPKLTFATALNADESELVASFPEARVVTTGEPRWERVLSRAANPPGRVRELASRLSGLERPWGVLGSAWPEDLALWVDELKRSPGTIWIVPHEIHSESLAPVLALLKANGILHQRTSMLDSGPEPQGAGSEVSRVLVDEMGFLLELYSLADWAYVGGGFGKGVHSTIEPAVYAIPVACGPARAESFPEVQELVATGQLSIVHDPSELSTWLGQHARGSTENDAQRGKWRAELEARKGSTARILEVLRQLCAQAS